MSISRRSANFRKERRFPSRPCAHFDRIDITARSNDHIHIDCYSFVNIDDGDPRAGFGDDRLRRHPRECRVDWRVALLVPVDSGVPAGVKNNRPASRVLRGTTGNCVAACHLSSSV